MHAVAIITAHIRNIAAKYWLYNTETSIVQSEELQLTLKDKEASHYNGKDWKEDAYQQAFHVVQWLISQTGLM